MNRYQKAIRYTKPLTEIDEKIDRLNEMMTTSGMYTVVVTNDGNDGSPPVFSKAPLGDFSDLDNFVWNDQGDGSSDTHDLSQLIATDADGNEQLVFDMPDLNYPTGTAYAMAFGPNQAVAGNSLGYISESGFVFVYQVNNVFSVERSEFQDAFVKAYEAGSFVQKTIYLWGPLLYRVTTPITASQYYPSDRNFDTTPKADKGLYAYNLLIPVRADGTPIENEIKTTREVPARPRSVSHVVSRNDLGDPNYYPGEVTNIIKSVTTTVKTITSNIVDTFNDFGESISADLSPITGAGEVLTGMGDGLNLLGDVQKTLDNVRSEGDIDPPSKPGERPTITPGAEGSAENPIQNNLSDSSIKVLQDHASNYNGDGSRESLISHFNSVTSSGETLGLKGTINNINTGEGDVYIRGNDIVIVDTYGFGPSSDIYNKPVVKQVADTISTIVSNLGGDGQEASEQVQTFFDQSGPLGAGAGVVASMTNTTSIGLPGKDDPVVYYETVIPGGAKNLGSNSKPVKEETLFEKYKKKTENKESVSKMDELSKALKSLPVPVKKVLLFEIKSSLKLMMMSPDERSFREKEIKMQGVNVYHDAYVDNQFPENVEQTSRVKKILTRNIELSDPKTFKDPKPALTYGKVFGDDPKDKKVKEKDFSKKSAGRFLKTEKKVDTSRTRWLKG